jgi:hypothetical protein
MDGWWNGRRGRNDHPSVAVLVALDVSSRVLASLSHPACAERSEGFRTHGNGIQDGINQHPCRYSLFDVVVTPKAETITFWSSVDLALQVGPCETYAVGETGTVQASVWVWDSIKGMWSSPCSGVE